MKTIMTIDEAYKYKKLNSPCVLILIGDKAEVFTDADIPEDASMNSIISLPRHKALIILKRAGYLAAVQAEVAKHGEEATISFENAPEIHSDNPLVNAVLGENGLGLTHDDIYKLFVDAKNI